MSRRDVAAALSDSAEDMARALERIALILAIKPRVVLLGEVNAGKTALANALVGEPLLPESALGNTRTVTILSNAPAPEVHATADGRRKRLDTAGLVAAAGATLERLEIGLPLPRLENYDLVDTPAIASIDDQPDITLSTRDLPVWCTRAGQAWKDSERRLWRSLPQRLKHRSVLAVTNADVLRDVASLEKVRARLIAETDGLFSAIVFTGKRRDDGAAPAGDPRYGTAALENAITAILTARANRNARVGQRIRARILGHLPAAAMPIESATVPSLH